MKKKKNGTHPERKRTKGGKIKLNLKSTESRT